MLAVKVKIAKTGSDSSTRNVSVRGIVNGFSIRRAKAHMSRDGLGNAVIALFQPKQAKKVKKG